jgi:uncharacterized protein (TIGR00369 family)
MSIWKVPMSLKELDLRSQNTMGDHVGIEFIEFGDDFLVARMPVDHRTKQPAGIMHGGASCVLAETVASTAANCCVEVDKFYCVGLEINTNHIRSITEGFVVGKAKPFHIGRTTQVWGIEITNEKQQLISINRLTLSVLNRRA